MAYFGYLAGYRLVDEAMRDDDLHNMVREYMDREAEPTLRQVSSIDIEDYQDSLIERVSSTATRDTVTPQPGHLPR
jgi:mannitol 2-dehydrogenase